MNDSLAKIPEGFLPLRTHSPFNALCGPMFCRLEGQALVIGLRVESSHCNSSGRLHGAMMCALADNVLSHNIALVVALRGGASIETLKQGAPDVKKATVSLTTDFLGTVAKESWVEARADVERVGSRIAFANGKLTHDNDTIALYSGVFRVFTDAGTKRR